MNAPLDRATVEPDAATDAAHRARRRNFIRTHHPDVGGDPDLFVAGLARLDHQDDLDRVPEDDRSLDADRAVVVHAHRRRTMRRRLRRQLPPPSLRSLLHAVGVHRPRIRQRQDRQPVR